MLLACPRSLLPVSSLFLPLPPPPSSTLFPYTTLFRSGAHGADRLIDLVDVHHALVHAVVVDDQCDRVAGRDQFVECVAEGGAGLHHGSRRQADLIEAAPVGALEVLGTDPPPRAAGLVQDQ